MGKCYTNNIIKNLTLKSLDIFMPKGLNMPIMKFFIIGLLFLIIGVNNLEAANKIWLPTNGGNWTTTTNWNPNGAPGATDDIVIGAQTGNITGVPNVTVNSLTINGNCNLASTANGNTITVSTTFSVGAGATLTLNGTNGTRPNLTLLSTVTGTIAGVVASGNAANIFTNGGSLDFTGAGSTTIGVASFINTGTINLNTTGAITGITNNGGGIVNLTNSGTITSFNNATATSTLYISDVPVPTITTLTTTVAGNTINYNGAGNQTVKDQNYGGNLIISGSGTKTWTLGAGRTVTGNLTVSSGELLTAGNQTLGITGTTDITGTLTLGGTSAKTFTGNVTINGTGVLTESVVEAINFTSDFTNNGTYTTTANTTGVHTFNGAGHIISGSGAIAMPYLTINNTITNNSTVGLTVSTNLSGTNTLTQGVNSILYIGGTSGITTLTATAAGNTVNYTGAAQTVHTGNYVNLNFSGSVAKTLQTGTTSITGNLTLSGSATTATVIGLTIGGNLNVGDGTTFTVGGYDLTVSGTTTVGDGASGTLTIGAYNGNKIFTGLLIKSGGRWNNSGGSLVTFRGGITNNGTFTPGSGTQTFDTNAQALAGTIDMTGAPVVVTGINLTNNGILTLSSSISGTGTLINASSGTVNSTAGITISTLTNQGTLNVSSNNLTPTTLTNTSTGFLNISGSTYTNPTTFTNQGTFTLTSNQGIGTAVANFTNTGTVNLNGTVYINGLTNNAGGIVNFINAAQTIGTINNATSTSVLNISALISSASAINTLTATAAGNTVNYSGAGAQTIKNTAYSNLTLSGNNTETFVGNTTIANNFSISSGVQAALGTGLTHTAGALYLNGVKQATSTWGGTGSSAANINTTYFTASTGIISTMKYWTGATSTDWNTATNWSDGILPTAIDDAIIPNVTNKPIISGSAVCNNLTVNTGSSLTINASNTLTISGNFVNNGTFTPNTGTVNYNGTNQTVVGVNYYNLTLSGSGTKTLQTGTTTIGGNLTLSGTATATTVVGLAISGNLLVHDGTTFTAAGFALTVTGTTTVGDGTSGNLSITSNTGTKTFTGDVTIAAGATWNNSGNSPITFQGSLTNNGTTFTAGSGTQTFSGANKFLSGASTTTIQYGQTNITGTYTNNGPCSLYTLSVTGSLTNNNTLGTTNLSGSGQFIQGLSSSVLLIGGPCTITTLTATVTGNTVRYFLPNLSIYTTNYYNLTLDGGGTDTAGSGLTVLGNLTIGSGTTFAAGTYTHNIAGNFANSGTFTAGSSTIALNGTTQSITGATTFNNLTLAGSGTKTFANNTTSNTFTINSGAIANLGTGLTHSANALSLAGAGQPAGSWGGTSSAATYINSTYFASGTGILNVATASCVAGSWTGLISTDWNTATNWCDGVVPTASANVIINSGGNQPVIGASAVCNNLTINSGASLTISGSNTLTVSGNWTNSGTFTPNTSTVIYNGGAQTIANVNYYGLTLSGSGTKTLQSGTTTIGGDLTLSGTASATAVVGLTINGNMTIGTGTTFTAGSFTHNVKGNWSNSGTFTATGSTINFNSDVASTINVSNFNNITISGAGAKTATGTLAVAGNFNISSGSLVFNNATSNTITIGGNFNQSGGLFDFNSNTSGSSAMTLNGNFIQTSGAGSMTTSGAGAPNGIITFNGSGTQTISTSTPGGPIWIKYSIPVGKSVQLLSNLTLNSADLASQAAFQGEMIVSGTLDLGTYTISQNDGVAGTAVVTVNSGANLISSNATGLSGSISATNMTTNLSSGANYEFKGASTGTFTTTPTANTVNNLTFSGTGATTLGSDFTTTGTLTINSGVNLSMSTYLLTLNGNFINNGTAIGTTGGVTIGGTGTQSIGSFTTTGTVSMTKTGGVATLTGNINGAGLTINGTGGTLNLGTGLTHTLTGNWTNTAGTLNGGSSLLKIGGSVVGSGGIFTAGTGTVEWNAAGAQTLAGVNYNNLTLSGSGIKTLSTGTSISGNLTTSGTASTTAVEGLTIGGNLIVGSGTTFAASTFTHNLGGNFSNSGTFTAGSSTLVLNGTTQSITGATTFNNLTLAGSGTKTFANATTTNGSFTINSGVVANLGTGLSHSANTLSLAGAGQSAGSWGGTTSSATFINPTYFATATGILNVATASCVAGIWTGYTSTDWNTTTNWCSGTVPTASTNVIISSGGNQPVIGAVAVCNNLTVNSGASLTITGSNTLTVSGNWANSGTFTPNTSTVIYNGAAQSIAGVNYYNLTLSGSGAKTLLAGTTSIGGDLTLSGTASATTAANLTIGGNLTVGTGISLTTGTNFTLGVTGTTSVTGSLVLAGTGTKTFTGDVTLNSGGIWNETGVAAINLGGSFTNNATTFTANTGTHTFSGATKILSGSTAIVIPTATLTGAYTNSGTLTSATLLTVTGTTLTNNGTITATTALSGTGGLTQGTNAVLNIGGTSGITTLSATATGNTVNYSGSAQIINSASYYNLTLSNSSGTETAGGALTVNGTLTTTSGGTLNMGTYQLLGTLSTVTNGGTIQTQNISATPIQTGKTWGGTVQYNATTGAQTVMTGTYNNLTLSNTSGTETASGALTVNGTLITTAGGTLNMGTYQLLGTLATITNGGTIQTQNTSVTPIPSGKTWAGSVVLNGTTGQTLPASTFNNLTINNTAGVTLSGAVGISGVLTLSNGIVTTSTTNLLTLTNTATTAISGGSTTAFINGPVNWTLPASLVSGSTYNFPVGKGSTYLPFSLVNPTTGTGVVTAQIESFGSNAGGTIDATLNSISNTEYWSLVTTGNFTNSSVSATRQTAISPNDVIAGSTTVAGQYTNLAGTLGIYGVTGSNAIGTNRAFVFASKKSTITTGTITGSPFCVGTTVSVPYTITGTFVSGNIFTAQLSDASGSFASPVNIGTLTSTTAGTISATIPGGSTAGIGYRIRVISSNPGITGTDNGVNLTISANPNAPTTTGGSICIGTTTAVTLSASGAIAGQKYTWYSAASGGTLLKTSTDNVDNTYTTPALGATTSYWVSILSAGGCEGTRTQVTATYPSVSSDDQNAAGANTWVGHVYDGTNQAIAYNGSFTNYYGHSTELETFDESFGGATTCYNIISNSVAQSIYTETFSVRYRMNSTKKGLYTVDLGSDDGSRLTVDGTLLHNNWADQAYSSRPGILLNLTGSSSLLYDFYENGGENRVVFQNLTQILANNLTTNTSQSISIGASGTAISGDVYGTLPTGISVSGTGYQWTYSTTPGGVRTNITGATGATYTPDATVAPFNVEGTYYIFRDAVLSSANNVSPNPYVATSESNAATLIVRTPLITVAPTSLTGFTYNLGSGPSTEQTFTVAGSYLVGNISIAPPADYEISLTSGGAFVATNPIILTPTAGAVATTTVYVRLKSGLAGGSYNLENIASTSTNAVTKNVACSGTVINIPLITTSVTTLTGLNYIVGNGPSAQQSFTVGGSYLVGNISIAPPTDYEISLTSGGAFVATNPIILTQTAGTVATTTVYVRLKAGLAINNYNLENIVATSTSAVAKNVVCSGSVNNVPLLTVTPTSLSGLNYIFGFGPSAEQTFTVAGSYLAGNISIAPPTDYEISLTSGGAFVATNPITLTPTAGTVATTTVYVRLKAGLAVGSYNAENIASTSTSAVTKNVAASGTVSNVPLITTSVTTLTGYTYVVGAGPATQQLFTVGGTYLIANLIVTPPADYEISTTSGSGFQSTPITLTQSSGTVATTTIYVRLKAGLAVGSYNLENVASTSTSAITKNVAASGTVTNSTQTFTTSTTFTVPANVTSVTVQAWGAGGGGSTRINAGRGGGGGGGAFASGVVTVTSGSNYAVSVGTGGTANTTGGNSAFNTNSVVAAGGSGATNNSNVFGAGGTVANSTGSIARFAGGDGATGGANYSGGGGGGAGTSGAGGTAPSTNLGTAGTGTSLNGGNGGAGINSNVAANNGLTYGGGGGGATRTSNGTTNGGSGANGLVIITWPVVTSSAVNLTGFTYYSGSGPSAQQSFIVTGTNLIANLVVTAPPDYEISTTSGSGFQSTPITLTQTAGTVAATTIYVRLKAGLAAGTYNAENVALSTTGIVTQNVSCSGNVIGTVIVTSVSSLTGFNYIKGYGPSGQQAFTVSGAYLNTNITVTPPTDYEISTTSGSGFISTPITLTQIGGNVATTSIYVRLKAGLNNGNYNSENIVLTSTGAINKNVSCSGTVYLPTITASPTPITTFTYPVGYGPSAVDSITVSGVNLVDNILVTPTTNFEISTTKTPFTVSSLITLPVSSSSVPSTKIYIRMKAGHALGAVAAENIASTSTGASTANVACSGTVVAASVITTTAISGTFSYVFGSGPSASQTFTVRGTNLGGSVIITPPVDYEISSNGGTNYYSTAITLPISTGNASTYTGVLNLTTITVRLKIGLGTGTYSENAVASSVSAVSQNVALSGNVSASATLTTIPSYLGAFSYTLGFGPSGVQSFVVTGTNLSGNVTVTPPASFEISTSSGSGFTTAAIPLTQSGGNVNATIYARLAAGLAVGPYGTSNVSLTSAGAVVKTVGLYGEVLAANAPKILSSKDIVTGFGYMQGTGPSSVQSFTLSGASLTSSTLTVALSDATYEISLSPTSGFQTSSITLTGTAVASSPASYKVDPTIIYIRLKAGNLAGNYNKTITLTSGSTTKNVSLVGVVFVSPLITAGGGGEYCAGSTINLTSTGADIQNRYWQGPNTFYSTDQNPVITNATTAMSGTYTVTGNVFMGGNLIYNGDFEAGNTGFGSSYGYVAPVAGALNPEGLYTVTHLPHDVHNDFTTYPDHTTGTGYQMVVNGAPTAGVVVWTQSVPVIPGATYQFSYSEQTVNITQVPKNASQLQLYVNGVAAGPVYTAPQVNYQWATFIYNAAAGSNTVLNLELINQNTIAAGNDFALDDIIFQQILPATSSTTVTVNPIVPVSISIAASPASPVYSNTPVTFTATPTNGGTTPAYQWKVKTAAGSWTNVGTNSPTYMYTPLQGDSVSCTLTSSLTCVTNNPATAKLKMTVIHRTNYWYGYVSTDWGNAANWTGKYIPAPGEDVEYATLANTPDSSTFAVRDLWLDHNRTIGSLINATIRRLVIPAAKGLTVNNTIDIVNKTNEADRIYIYSSTTAANGSLIYHNAVDNPVSATVEMYSKAWWNLSDTINNKYRWQYFGIPLRSVKAEPTFYGSYVRKWYETGTTIQNHWIQLQNDSVLHPYYGYEICQAAPKTIYFKGILENGNFNSGALAITPTALYPGQHVMANPYTAAIDIKQLVFGSSTEASVYLYNTGTYSIWEFDHGQTSSTSNEGQYMVVPKGHAGDIGIPRQVPSMQAMVIKAKAATDPTFSINYNQVVMTNTDQQRVQGISDDLTSDKVGTEIDLVGTHYSDKMWLFSEPGCTSGFDNGFDGFKMAGNAFTPQLYSLGSDGIYQVNTTDNVNDTEIAFQAGSDVEYRMIFTNQNITKQYQALYLLDLVENKTVDITQSGTEYLFQAESTPKPINRFRIVTRPYEKNAPDLNSQLKIFSSGKTIFVDNQGNLSGDLYIYDIAGHFIKKAPFALKTITSVSLNISTGAYIVKAVTSGEDVSKRVLIK